MGRSSAVGRDNEGAIAGRPQRPTCRLDEAGILLSRRTRVLQSILVVVGEQLGVVLRAAARLDPASRAPMLLRASDAGNLAVRHITKQDVAKCIFGVTLDRRLPSALNELLAFQRNEQLFGATHGLP